MCHHYRSYTHVMCIHSSQRTILSHMMEQSLRNDHQPHRNHTAKRKQQRQEKNKATASLEEYHTMRVNALDITSKIGDAQHQLEKEHEDSNPVASIPPGICMKYNRGHCRLRKKCPLRHVCSYCRGDHPCVKSPPCQYASFRKPPPSLSAPCWICHGWVETRFVLRQPRSTRAPKSLRLHLSVDGWRAESMKLHSTKRDSMIRRWGHGFGREIDD